MHRRLDLLIRSVQRGVDHVHPDAIRSADQIFAWKTHNHSLKGIDLNSKNPSAFSRSICCLLSPNLNRLSHLPMIEFSPQWLISFRDVSGHFLSCSLQILFVIPRKRFSLIFFLVTNVNIFFVLSSISWCWLVSNLCLFSAL